MPNKSYRKGVRVELEVVHFLRERGWNAHRVTGSGRQFYGKGVEQSDVWAVHEDGGMLLSEVKSWRKRNPKLIRFEIRDIEKLLAWCEAFKPLLCGYDVPITPVLIGRFPQKYWNWAVASKDMLLRGGYIMYQQSADKNALSVFQNNLKDKGFRLKALKVKGFDIRKVKKYDTC